MQAIPQYVVSGVTDQFRISRINILPIILGNLAKVGNPRRATCPAKTGY